MRRRRSLLLAALLLLLLVGGGLFVGLDGLGLDGPGSAVEEASQPRVDPVESDEISVPVGVDERKRRRVAPDGEGQEADGETDGETEGETEGEQPEDEPERTGTAEGDGPDRPKPGAAGGAGPTPSRSGHPLARPVTKRAAGIVVAAETGEPIAGARIRYALMKENMPAGWWGSTSEADGTFEVLVRDRKDLADAPRELIVDAAGYLIFRMGSPGEQVVARLERQTEPEVPGTITGIISQAPKGALAKPVTGPVLIQGTGEYGSYIAQWVIAGEDGRYRMEGVPPRYWNLWTPRGRLPVLVPPGGEATLALTTTGNYGSKGGSGERRAVVVTGLPDDARDVATLRAEVKPRLFWRTVTADGRATLELPHGEWTLVLSWGIDQELRQRLRVGPGEGALEVDLEVDGGSSSRGEKRAILERAN